MKKIQLFLVVFNCRWNDFSEKLDMCRTEFSPELVHDLRVSMRRMLAAIEMARTAYPHPHLQKIRRAFKDQIDDLDELRDTQVMLVEVSENIQNLPSLKSFQGYLQKRERKLLRAARKNIEGIDSAALKKRIAKAILGLEEQAKAGFEAKLFTAVDIQYAAVLQRSVQVDASVVSTIHRLRLSFKKFRYMVEIIHPALDNPPEYLLKHMHGYQDVLGQIQDAEVLLRALNEFATKDEVNLKAADKHYRKFHKELIGRFIENLNEVRMFWRPTPNAKFPWEAGPVELLTGMEP